MNHYIVYWAMSNALSFELVLSLNWVDMKYWVKIQKVLNPSFPWSSLLIWEVEFSISSWLGEKLCPEPVKIKKSFQNQSIALWIKITYWLFDVPYWDQKSIFWTLLEGRVLFSSWCMFWEDRPGSRRPALGRGQCWIWTVFAPENVTKTSSNGG